MAQGFPRKYLHYARNILSKALPSRLPNPNCGDALCDIEQVSRGDFSMLRPDPNGVDGQCMRHSCTYNDTVHQTLTKRKRISHARYVEPLMSLD